MRRGVLSKFNSYGILEVVAHLGINLNARLRAPCPGNHGSKSRAPFAIYPDSNKFYCHSCEKGGGPVDLWMLARNASFHAALNEMNKEIHHLRVDVDKVHVYNEINCNLRDISIFTLLMEAQISYVWEEGSVKERLKEFEANLTAENMHIVDIAKTYQRQDYFALAEFKEAATSQIELLYSEKIFLLKKNNDILYKIVSEIC